jgi:DNA-binding MarR family transcriptional regulator/GNAT superfamily N-acetyltransferase
MDPQTLDRRIAAVRGFNRFYTRQIGLLQEGMVETRFSLSEARVLYEIGSAAASTASALAAALDLDPGYLSRMLRAFGKAGLIQRERSATDRRQTLLTLSAKGRAAFAALDRRSQQLVGEMLARLDDAEQQRLVTAMQTVRSTLAPPGASPAILLRPHRGGDAGWILAAHARLYAAERGWGAEFEALVAEILAQFLKSFDPARERCWIAEMDGEPVGSVFLANGGDGVAKLRLLLVEPRARGHGVGQRLVAECIRFARECGYRTVTLWTQSILTSARTIYEKAGFRLVRQEPHCSFGHDLVGETWELTL